jgi:hypothetical protein
MVYAAAARRLRELATPALGLQSDERRHGSCADPVNDAPVRTPAPMNRWRHNFLAFQIARHTPGCVTSFASAPVPGNNYNTILDKTYNAI